MTPRRIYIFVNPIAGGGKSRDAAEMLRRLLAGVGFEVSIWSERPSLAPPADPGDIAAALAVGGDGTVREMAEWALRQVPDEQVKFPLGVVPMGTANLLGRHLGLDWMGQADFTSVVRAILARRVVVIDAARANGRLMLLVAGVGLDAAVVHQLEKTRTGPISKMSYLGPIARCVGRYDFPAISVRVDERPIFNDRPGLAFVGNVREYGTGFAVLPKAKADDGKLDVCVLPCESWHELTALALLAMAGEHLTAEGAVYVKGRSVAVESVRSVPVQIDGDAAGATPLRIDMMAHGIPFLVS